MTIVESRQRPVPPQVFDPARLAAVRRTGLLDTGPEEPFDRLARLAATLLDTPFAFVTLVDDSRSFWKSCIGVDVTGPADRQNTVSQSFCQYVIGAGQEVIVRDARTDERTWDNPSIDLMGVAAWAGFPVHSPDGHVLGSFCAVDTRPRDWTGHDVEVLRSLSHAVAGEFALRQAVREAEEAARQAKLAARRAIELAGTLQESLLPPVLPAILGVQVAARYRRGSGEDVLGDFYDVFPSTGGSWAAVVGDVTGKGPQAAKVTGLARYTLRAAAIRCAVPSRNLATVNTALRKWPASDVRFLTAVYATLRPHAQGFAVRVSCGGHEPALVRRADGTVTAVGRHGLLLGVSDHPHLYDQRTMLRPGDSLLLFTDGVTEARRPGDREMFGADRLREVVARTRAGSAEDLVAAVDAAVREHDGGRAGDDTAMLALHLPRN